MAPVRADADATPAAAREHRPTAAGADDGRRNTRVPTARCHAVGERA